MIIRQIAYDHLSLQCQYHINISQYHAIPVQYYTKPILKLTKMGKWFGSGNMTGNYKVK